MNIGIGFDKHQQNVDATDRFSCCMHHGAVQGCFRLVHSGRVQKNQLGIRVIFDAGYFISCRLRFVGDDGYFIADNGIE